MLDPLRIITYLLYIVKKIIMSLVKDINELEIIDEIQCIPEHSRLMLYTEEVLNGTNYCMVFKLSDIDKFGDGAFNRFDIRYSINHLKQKEYSSVFSHYKWKVKFVKIIAFHDVDGGLSYMISDLDRNFSEITVDEIYQISADIIKSGLYTKIHHIEYYDTYQSYIFDRYIEKYESSQRYK